MNMIEQVARAIFHEECEPHKAETGYGDIWDWPDVVPVVRERHRAYARAAIQAMREPTEWMIDAGVAAKTKLYKKFEAEGINTRTLLVANHPAGTIYEAMIDAALSETSEES